MNPWIIEVQQGSKYDVRLLIVNQNTGEIRIIDLDVNDIDKLIREREELPEVNE